ncbi:MAG TPA: hypothetical protein HA362_03710 [Nanoarchaeota archaeon]|nr:hypothetical protein [Nanoarchaeota archaeon]
MPFSLTLPALEKGASVKDYIISILSSDWPLTAKKLHISIKKRFGRNVTYQAVYKAVRELVGEGVLRQNNEGYEISEGWIKKLHSFTEIVQSNYFTKQKTTAIEGLKEARREGEINVLTFENYFDTEKYLYYLQKHSIFASKNKVICMHHLHEWAPLFYLRAEYNKALAAKGQGIKIYRICSGSTAADKWAASFYREMGYCVKTGVSCGDVCELLVVGDTVIQIYLPAELREKLSVLLGKKRIEEVDIKRLASEVFEKKTAIEVVISSNVKIADQIREKTKAYFKR